MGCVNCEFVTVIIIAVIPRMNYLMICQVAEFVKDVQKNSQPQEQRNSKRLNAYSHSGTQL